MFWPTFSFPADHLHSYAYWNKFLTPEECKKIIDYGNSLKLNKATALGEYGHKVRKSDISWIDPNPEINWLFERTAEVINNLNSQFFKFDLWGFRESFQFTKYKSPGGKFTAHTDRGINFQSVRKLSITIQLSDPKKYTGGKLKIIQGYEKDAQLYPPNEQGTLIAFPSFVLHEVTPVTKGERYSLVNWIAGPNFR